MAKMVLLASFLSVNGTDYSSLTSKIELSVEVEEKDVTTFGSLGWKEVLGGIKSSSLAATFKQDIADGSLDETIWGLFGTVVPFAVRLDGGAVSASNPEYQGNVLVSQWSPIAGSVGDVAEVEATWPVSGAIVRDVTP